MKPTTYKQKMQQANREAKATAVALIVTILAWIVLGFGLAGTGIELFHTPLWVLGGTVGIYIVSIVVVLVLRYFVFEDFDLDRDAPADTAVAATAATTPADTAIAAIAPAGAPGQEVDHD